MIDGPWITQLHSLFIVHFRHQFYSRPPALLVLLILRMLWCFWSFDHVTIWWFRYLNRRVAQRAETFELHRWYGGFHFARWLQYLPFDKSLLAWRTGPSAQSTTCRNQLCDTCPSNPRETHWTEYTDMMAAHNRLLCTNPEFNLILLLTRRNSHLIRWSHHIRGPSNRTHGPPLDPFQSKAPMPK